MATTSFLYHTLRFVGYGHLGTHYEGVRWCTTPEVGSSSGGKVGPVTPLAGPAVTGSICWGPDWQLL
jgi:hypothetical protein